MMHTQSPQPAHHHLVPRAHRVALTACGLVMALMVLIGGAHRAFAHPASSAREATVEIPSLGVSLPVVRGGQDVIDRGVAAHYVGAQWRPPTDPGRPGTYWLAAHNSTHGSPFASLPAIARGAEIRIIKSDGTVFTYLVTSHDVVGTTTTLANVYGQDATTSRILLQTCEGAAKRLLVHGTLTSVTPG